VRFVNTRNTAVRGVTSVNPKFFHMALLQARGVRMSGLRISAPAGSPNTDGIHIERSAGVSITDARIGTGDDCISIGQGNDGVDVARVRCGPGHGMSVGSLGRYAGEGDVTRVRVRDVVFTGTDNGVRIKTWENSPTKSSAAHMLFESLLMVDVRNPIIIDQKYCPYYTCEHKVRATSWRAMHVAACMSLVTTIRISCACETLMLLAYDVACSTCPG
jgi:polygalacturonase